MHIAITFLQIIFFRIVVCLLESFHFNLTTLTETDIEGKRDRKNFTSLSRKQSRNDRACKASFVSFRFV